MQSVDSIKLINWNTSGHNPPFNVMKKLRGSGIEFY